MMTALLLLSLSQAPEPLPLVHACESSAVERPALALGLPDWAFVVIPETACDASKGAASTMFALDVDPTEPVQSEERTDLDIYLPE